MPAGFTAKSFDSYPAEGRALAVRHLALLRQAPSALLPPLLVDLVSFDVQFPVQQEAIKARLALLGEHSDLFEGFRGIRVPDALFEENSVRSPKLFLQALTAYLWSSGQMDAFRSVSGQLVQEIASRTPAPALPISRVIVVLLGRGAEPGTYPLFDRLREGGQFFTNFNPDGAESSLTQWLQTRAADAPLPYGHWYLDGGEPFHGVPSHNITTLTYHSVMPVNREILKRMQSAIRDGTGTEGLRTKLTTASLQELGAGAVSSDPRMQHLAVSLLTEGSGTQLFSTTFVQWATREILRQAQPVTMLVRFGPRQKQRDFNAMVDASPAPDAFDPFGSLIDGDMAAWYTWLELRKLPSAEPATLLAWLEGQSRLIACGPAYPAATRTDRPVSFAELLHSTR